MGIPYNDLYSLPSLCLAFTKHSTNRHDCCGPLSTITPKLFLFTSSFNHVKQWTRKSKKGKIDVKCDWWSLVWWTAASTEWLFLREGGPFLHTCCSLSVSLSLSTPPILPYPSTLSVSTGRTWSCQYFLIKAKAFCPWFQRNRKWNCHSQVCNLMSFTLVCDNSMLCSTY